MSNLTTRKIVLGMLITLVLAFSVQGTADAIDLVTEQNETVALTTAPEVGTGFAITGNITLREQAIQESVTISISSGIQLTSPVFSSRSLTLTERDPDDATDTDNKDGVFFSGSTPLPAESATAFPISGYFTSYGKKTITITDKTRTSTDPVYTNKGTVTFTFYVVRSDSDISSTATISLQGIRNGYQTGVSGNQDFVIHRADRSHYPVRYSVLPANRLYIKGANNSRIAVPNTAISSAVEVWLDANGLATFVRGDTNVVTVMIGASTTKSEFKAAYIYGTPTLGISLTDSSNTPIANLNPDKYEFTDGTAGENAGTITATVMDGKDTPVAVPGVVVKFDLVDKSTRGGYLSYGGSTDVANRVDAANMPLMSPPSIDRTLYVRTNDNGVATVNYRFGTASGKQRITVTTLNLRSKEVTAELISSDPSQILSRKSNERQPGDSKKYDLVALVEDDGDPVLDKVVTFRTSNGILTRVSALATGNTATETVEEVDVVTNALGEAHVVYDIDDNTGRQEIHASIVSETNDRQEVTFVINRSATPPPTARLTITSTGAGTTRTVTVNAIDAAGTLVTGVSAVLGSFDFTLSEAVTTGTATIITLPSTPGNYRLLAADPLGVYAQGSITVPLVAPAALGTLTITTVGASVNRQQTIQVTARKADGTVPGETFSVALTGAGISRTVDILPNGSGRAIITLPATAGPHTLTVRADGYTDGAVTLTTTGQTVTPTTPPTPRGPVGEVDSVEIDGQRQLSSTVNQATRLRVRVLDANDNGVADVRVTFRVLAPGRGTFSGSRGNGRGVTDESDRNGYASANFTPSDDGDIIVRATAAGVRDPVTFIIDVGAATADTETPTPSRDVAPSREISPVVHLGVASRPPMLWVDGGAIYALVGASAQKFAPGVDNALNITVGGGKVYWTEKTGESGGTVNSANLNGSDVKELASIFATPIGIAVDTAGSKLYWTNSRGRIQSANLDGSGITNELQDLPSPMDIALARGLVYWTQGNGSVRFVNLTGQRIVRDISTGTDTPGSLVIGGGKVYWTEMTGDSSGTVNSANLNGTGATQLASILAAPSGIAVDTARSKLYWTNSRGRIQSADLDGSKITNVVSGLGSPGELVLSNSITAPTAATTTTTTTASNKYDVNGDGAVDAKDSDVLIIAVAAEITDAKYDVNGDGTVDINDVVAVRANRDPGAAGAPTLVGMKLSAVQIDRLQEQIDLLIATNDRSPAALRTLIYLQQLLVTARPEKTQLLANYPNPFNPETWIPYELATDTDVRLTIYNTQGVVIRTLQFGHQSAGYYTGRDRAAYWDGRNALGEQVASGLYFYQLETDEMSLMRKMVILK